MPPPARDHTSLILQEWHSRDPNSIDTSGRLVLGARPLLLKDIVAVARHSHHVQLDSNALSNLKKSIEVLHSSIRKGEVVYGVNTGFGGSADTRTNHIRGLQATLLREMHCGILDTHDQSHAESGYPRFATEAGASPEMPDAWVRAAILIRIKSLLVGCSAIRPVLLERMSDLLFHGITPVVPLRGSISASGDLSPLSYIGGALQGKTAIMVHAKDAKTGRATTKTAKRAFAEAGLTAVQPEAKEGLAIVNGTAVSCAVGALALYDSHGLAVMSQVLTAMSVEALCGNPESFDPFFAHVRPHPGQMESARNILAFLKGSSLATDRQCSAGTLRQDRYSIRTASQWLGPVLEDLVQAHQQMMIESNSVTDNPLVDSSGHFLHGGNFQAKAVTSAMEKVRQGLQSIGRMLFAQCTEMINPATNNGLTPNLVGDEPSESFVFKSVDIMLAALQSELGFLANPAGSHGQTAEMGNQALNSLALISARYTHVAVDVLAQMQAAHLVAACQALDIRAMDRLFLETLARPFRSLVESFAQQYSLDMEMVQDTLWKRIHVLLDQTARMDSRDRMASIAASLQQDMLTAAPDQTSPSFVSGLRTWTMHCAEAMLEAHNSTRTAYSRDGTAEHIVGMASARMYRYVRHDLRIPFLCTRVLEEPQDGDGPSLSVGSAISVVYRALRSGDAFAQAIKCLKHVEEPEASEGRVGAAGGARHDERARL